MNDDRVSEDRAQRILQRAAELDVRAPDTSLAELRAAAIEAGIAPDAFERALQRERHDQSVALRHAATTRRWLRRGAMVVTALAVVYALLFLLPWRWNTTPRQPGNPPAAGRRDSTVT